MTLIETELPGCIVIEPKVFDDDRGWFYESWNRERFADAGLAMQFVQSNVSCSQRGVLRGLHYQWPRPQGKLVSVLEGEVWDVAVDIRRGSPAFGKWAGALLSSENRRHFWIPEGFAHGFVVLSEHAMFSYLCTAVFDASADAAVRWDDPQLAIEWPVREPRLSAKDAAAPWLTDVPQARMPVYRPEQSR